MKKILFVVDERKMGGVSILLEDMLKMLNLKNKQVDILVLHDNGDRLSDLPNNVKVMYGTSYFEPVDLPIKEVIKSNGINTKENVNRNLIVIAFVSAIISFFVTSIVSFSIGASEEKGYSGPTSGLPFILCFMIFLIFIVPVTTIVNALIITINKKNPNKKNLCTVISVIFNLAIVIMPAWLFMLIL